jgi:hypothetical protein
MRATGCLVLKRGLLVTRMRCVMGHGMLEGFSVSDLANVSGQSIPVVERIVKGLGRDADSRISGLSCCLAGPRRFDISVCGTVGGLRSPVRRMLSLVQAGAFDTVEETAGHLVHCLKLVLSRQCSLDWLTWRVRAL